MNGLLQLLLRLQELDLLKRGLELAISRASENRFEAITETSARLRRQVPGLLLSDYDAVAHTLLDPMSAVANARCSACGCSVTRRVVAQIERGAGVHRYPRCGRFLYFAERAPEYLSAR